MTSDEYMSKKLAILEMSLLATLDELRYFQAAVRQIPYGHTVADGVLTELRMRLDALDYEVATRRDV